MTRAYTVTAAILLAMSAAAWGQSPAPQRMPDNSMPVPPGQNTPEAQPKKAPGAGMVVVPPKTDPGAVAKPPANVDPKMDDATGAVDRKNRETSKEKAK